MLPEIPGGETPDLHLLDALRVDPAAPDVVAVIELADVGLDVEERGAVQHVDPADPDGVALDGDDLDEGDPDRVRAAEMAYGKDPALLAAVDERALAQAKAVCPVEVVEEDDVGEPLDPFEPLGILGKDLDRPLRFGEDALD